MSIYTRVMLKNFCRVIYIGNFTKLYVCANERKREGRAKNKE
ncbi:hypothetical protein [Wolbachia endosymbiont (group B) of Eucosma cana]|nr:hypothetical protein [Wolbachia endosymbiont (group B) of Eucosma cana]